MQRGEQEQAESAGRKNWQGSDRRAKENALIQIVMLDHNVLKSHKNVEIHRRHSSTYLRMEVLDKIDFIKEIADKVRALVEVLSSQDRYQFYQWDLKQTNEIILS